MKLTKHKHSSCVTVYEQGTAKCIQKAQVYITSIYTFGQYEKN